MVKGRTKNATNPHKNDVGKLSFLTMNNFSMIIFWVWVRVEKRNFGFGLREKTRIRVEVHSLTLARIDLNLEKES